MRENWILYNPRYTGSGQSVYETRNSGSLYDSMHSNHSPRVYCLWHFGDVSRFDKMLLNTNSFEVWEVIWYQFAENKISYCLDRNFSWENQLLWISDVPKSCGLIFWPPYILFPNYLLDQIANDINVFVQNNKFYERFHPTMYSMTWAYRNSLDDDSLLKSRLKCLRLYKRTG